MLLDKIRMRIVHPLDVRTDILNRAIQTNLSTLMLHQRTFPPFKAIHTGKEVAVVATGPSLKKYQPMEGCIHISINSAFKFDRVEFDYLFAHDYFSVKKYLPEMNAYRRGKCVKFYGICDEHIPNFFCVIPESDAIEAGALRYRTDMEPIPGMATRFAYDLSTCPLGDCYSTVFSALQFALWTNPKRIYIVGCDCTDTGHWDSPEKAAEVAKNRPMVANPYEKIRAQWDEFKVFSKNYYPATEIVSVNPVGLTGLFNDLNQY